MLVPLTIITGYLGSGKTTLLKKIAERSGRKIAILMNEFGDIAIDSKIVEGKNIKMAELAGGCVCCSLSGEFEAAVEEILREVKPEWIVVETTGVAEPAALAYDVVENIKGVRLDAIITIVDCDAMVRFPSLGHTGREQIELADILILNKIELVNKEQLDSIHKGIHGISKRAVILETVQSDVPMEAIFGIDRKNAVEKHRTHKIEFDYFDFVSDGKLSHERFLDFLEKLPPEIYRSKGFVVTDEGCFLINYVGGRYTIDGHECGRIELVFIGKGISKFEGAVKKALSQCII